ncbi:hypothetical protein TFLX_04490 [Thermoflexales bacterium]|nr:hypothetical protein TFLX_04490 [Thermoflexales bacterium]
MHRMNSVIVTMCIVGVLLISSCAVPPQPTQSPLQQPGVATTSPLATPIVDKPPLLKIEQAGTATVGGRLLRLNNTPLKNITIYVAAIDDVTGTKLASIDPAIAPRSETDSNGYFSFSGLTPGEYALVVTTPKGLILPETSAAKSVVFTAQADEVNDMGTVAIVYEYLDN